MFEEDIDWTDAASDMGLVALCREMEALGRPLDALAVRTRSAQKAMPHKRTQTTARATNAGAAILFS